MNDQCPCYTYVDGDTDPACPIHGDSVERGTENQPKPPINPKPADATLPQQEKRWTKETVVGGFVYHFGSAVSFVPSRKRSDIGLFDNILATHNATLSEPKPEVKWSGIAHDVHDCQWIDCAQHRTPAARAAESRLVANIWTLIDDYENPEPETAAFIPRENFGSTLRTLLMSSGLPFESRFTSAVAPSVVADVEEHAMGVSSDEEEIARETAAQLGRYEYGDANRIILAAIRKAKSLSEPKESEEEKHD